MADIQNRPFSKDYSGLLYQSAIGLAIAVLCLTSQELMKRKRRGNSDGEELGSRESWQFGYLYQGRSWAKWASPPSPAGWPLSWAKQAAFYPEAKINQLRGIDATLYTVFMRGCFWFTLLQSLTTFLILFPIHVEFSEGTGSPKSMTRASISSLVQTTKGLSLLWIHICLLFWITLTWMFTLLWICRKAFRLRAQQIERAKERNTSPEVRSSQFHPHPHPPYGFQDVPPPNNDGLIEGLRLRTVMVSNVPPQLRSEKELKEYFEYFMTRSVPKPSVGLTSATQPGLTNKLFAFMFNRAKRIPVNLPHIPVLTSKAEDPSSGKEAAGAGLTPEINTWTKPVIEHVTIARKMTELAHLVQRREEILRRLETAHIKLAKKTLLAVKHAMDYGDDERTLISRTSAAFALNPRTKVTASVADEESGPAHHANEDDHMKGLILELAPYIKEFELNHPTRNASTTKSKYAFRRLRAEGSQDSTDDDSPPVNESQGYPPSSTAHGLPGTTIWEALLNVPRRALDAYQPLVHLSVLFRGKTVPAIDYYTAKLNLLTSLITENRAKAVTAYDPVSTAFVTFADPNDARRACKYLAVHPNNPLACMVTMAPAYQDLDWMRVMKASFKAEFLKDWVVNIGVWAFTVFWLLPVSLLVGLVSIQNISLFLPSLEDYLNKHPWVKELIQSFIPTLIVSILMILIPLILLLIAKKAHTITTLSALHDRIMTRYYKFLIVNLLVFFCVGTTALQSFLQSFRSATRVQILNIVADSFPTAGPFYVGWLIFIMGMHGGFEIALLGLPLIMYPSTSHQITPRKRAVGIRPRTFNFYYWLPNHLLVIHVLLLFAVLNPLLLPFGTIYFFLETGVVKNQLIHVYAKNYEGNGHLILIRLLRYSLDGLILSQAVFMVYMVVLKKNVNVGLAAFLIVFTVFVKIILTRLCRAQFEADDILEASIVCRVPIHCDGDPSGLGSTQSGVQNAQPNDEALIRDSHPHSSIWTWRLPGWANFSYNTVRHRPDKHTRRRPNPFGPQGDAFSELPSPADIKQIRHALAPSVSWPALPHERNGLPHQARRQTAPSAVQSAKPRPAPFPNESIVVPHSTPISWDDNNPFDPPYDNPYYTRTINDALWLPRNPFGILNLDDTVDLRRSITTDPTQSKIGTWLGLAETSSPMTSASLSLPEAPGDDGETTIITGTEEIILPLKIAKRINEDDIEQAEPRRPSTFRKASSGDREGIATGSRLRVRRPSAAATRQPSSTFRSFSSGSAGQPRPRSSSIMSVLSPNSPAQLGQTDDQLDARPDTHAQADFVRSNLSIVSHSASRLSLPQKLSRSKNITAQEAVIHEVMAEERTALEERLRDEVEEAEATTKGRSWLTGWMFRKVDNDVR